jgi:hypothetical protein
MTARAHLSSRSSFRPLLCFTRTHYRNHRRQLPALLSSPLLIKIHNQSCSTPRAFLPLFLLQFPLIKHYPLP